MNSLILCLAQEAAAPAGPKGGGMMMIAYFAIIIAIFYFMMIRPQQRREKERRSMIDQLVAGQRVLFAGGLIGTITEAKQATFIIQIAPNTHIEVARGAILRVIKDGETPVMDDQKA